MLEKLSQTGNKILKDILNLESSLVDKDSRIEFIPSGAIINIGNIKKGNIRLYLYNITKSDEIQKKYNDDMSFSKEIQEVKIGDYHFLKDGITDDIGWYLETCTP